MAELAQAYVQIIPSAEGISGNIEKVMSPEADSAGKKSGTKFTSSFSNTLGAAGGKMTAAGKKISVGVSAPIAALGTAAVASWKSVDSAMDTVTTKTGASGKALTDMQNRAKSIATTIPVSFQQAGDAIGEVNTRFGLTGNSLEKLSTQFVKFAKINNTDVSTSVDSVQTAMAAFGVKSQDASKMLDTLNKAGQDTGVSVIQLANDLSTNAGTLKQMGYSASDATMLLANLSKNGVDTSSAMMGLNKVYAESVKTGKPMNDILSDLTKRLQNSSTSAKAAQEATDLFGNRVSSKLIPALKDGRLSFDQLGTSLSDYSGNVSKTFSETEDPLDKMEVNMNKLKNAGAELVDAAAPMITQAMTGLSNVIDKVTGAWNSLDKGQQQTILKIAGIAAIAGPAISIGGKAVSTIGTVVNGISSLGSGISGLVGKLGGIASGAGSAVESVSSVGSAASSAAAPVASAGTSMGTLSQNALGLVAAGAGILMAAGGIALLANSAIKLGQAGTPAAVAMVGLTAATAGMAVGAAALAPALTAGAVGLVAFGAGVALIGGGIFLATSGVSMLGSRLPMISTYGMPAATAMVQLGTGLTVFSVGALAAAGSSAALALGFVSLAVPMAAVTVESAALALALKGVKSSVSSIASNASKAGSSLKSMVTSVNVVSASVSGLKSKLSSIGSSIVGAFTNATPSATSAARNLAASSTNALSSGLIKGGSVANSNWRGQLTTMKVTTSVGLTGVRTVAQTGIDEIKRIFSSANLGSAFAKSLNNLNNTTRGQMNSLRGTVSRTLSSIQSQFSNTKLRFNENIALPHFSMSGTFDAKSGKVPTVGVKWYRKAYDEAYVLNSPTIFGAMNGNLLGGGDGSGSEIVIGTDKLIDVIREAVNSTGFTQNVTINSPTQLNPSEAARQTRNATRQAILAINGI